MTLIQRLRPDPIPAIHPLPEYLAVGQLAERYAEMKRVLQVPWMGVVTMAYAHYPTFFGELWRGLKPLCQSRVFVEACQEMRDYVEARAAELAPKSLLRELAELGYAPREIEGIGAINAVFSHGNQPYLLIAAITRHLLELGNMGGNGSSQAYAGRHAPEQTAPLVLMEAHHADQPTQAVYQDIRTRLQLPFVNTDYRAFARWPSYFALAWNGLREVVGTPAHEAICQDCHDRAARLAAELLPNPGGLSSAALWRATQADAPQDEIIQMCRLFQWLLPGLITNVAFFRQQLGAVR